jgi:hypothetical protein
MEMPCNKSSNKWLIGLGIGCGGVVVVVILIAIAGYFFIRSTTQGFRDSQALMKTLEQKYGPPEAFVPSPDGAIGADRLEVFLAVREACAEARKGLDASLDTMAQDRQSGEAEGRRSRGVLSSIRAGVGMIPQLSEFMKSRAQALLDRGMGLGEYYYIYVVAYYSWLKKSPEDGASIQLRTGNFGPANRNSEDAREMTRDMTLRRVHRVVLPMLEKQLAGLRSAAGSGAGRGRETWAAALEAEIKPMETDSFRIPWPDGVPEIIGKSLGPYRDRLEASYSRATNILEFILEQR